MYAFLRRNGRAFLVTLGALAWATLPFAVFAQNRTELPAAELAATMENGFARLVFTFSEEVKSDVQLSDNNVLIIRFAKPMRVPVERVQTQFKDFVQAARADPDGAAIRIAFLNKLTVNVMEAGEKLFIDLLPEGWTGLPPGLPQEVVDDLAKRALAAERKARAEQDKPRVWQPVRLRLAEAPTFSRFAFSMSEPIAVHAEQDGQELKIVFNAPVKLELGEAPGALPASVVSLTTDYSEGFAVARIVVAPNTSIRHFREQSAFIVDVTPPASAKPEQVHGEAQQPAVQQNVSAEVQQAQPPAQNERLTVEPSTAQPKAEPEPVRQQPQQATALALPPEPTPEGPLTSDVRVTVTQASSGVQVNFAFMEPVAAAVFRRGDRIWMAFDTKRQIDIGELTEDGTRSFSDVSVTDSEHGKLVRLKLRGGWLTSAQSDGFNWTVHFGNAVVAETRPLIVSRANEDSGAVLAIPLDGASKGKIHRIEDREIGDEILVVTAMPPVRGILRSQDFLEFKMLPSAHGIALLPVADDVNVALRGDSVLVGRPKGLSLSSFNRPKAARVERVTSSPLDATLWEAERNRRFRDREEELFGNASAAAPENRLDTRLTLATFYLAHGLATEAKGVLDAIVREDTKAPVNARFFMLRGLAELMIGRAAKSLDNLTNGELADSQDAALLRAIAYADLASWPETREQYRAGKVGLRLLPINLQRRVLMSVLRAAVEVRDYTEAARLLGELDTTEVPQELAAQHAVLAGRIAEGLGRIERAESLYLEASKDHYSPAAAEARYRLVGMKLARKELNRAQAIEQLESMAFAWRGDRIELETSRMLSRLYVEEARYRDAFRLLDAALLSQANASLTRTLQNEMSQVFEDLFLSGKADALPAIEALALYYDFSKLTPIGRRGDELIRRLSERLVSVDLLDQASELLQHQVEFRLTGAAKAQVAARLAIIHLMNRKPQKAVAILGATRFSDMPKDLREQRILLESRALMSANRFNQAIDIVASMKGPEAERQRADIHWQAKRWRQAGEATEILLGERWKDDEPLTDVERYDVLRAGLSYALAGENLSLSRLKEKFAPRLAGTPEKEAFEQLVTNPGPRAISAATKLLSNVDSLAVFLKMYHARFATSDAAARNERLSLR